MTTINRRPSFRAMPTRHNGVLSSAPRSFKIMFGLVTTFISIAFIAALALVIMAFVNGGGYSYKVDYQIGNSSYSEEYSYNR